MRCRIQRWGNSLALRIPKPFAEDTGVGEGAEVELSVREGKLVAAPVRRPRFTLDVLLAGVRRANLHRQVDFGRPAGREVW